MSTSRNNKNNKNNNKKKNTNPLYVVRNNGVDVEPAHGILELILKKTGIDKMIPVLEAFFAIILSQVQTYAVFIEVKKLYDMAFEKVIELIFQVQQMTQKKKV